MFNRAIHTQTISELRSRSTVSVPSIAGQSARSRGERNQNRALRSAVASVRGAIDWDDSAGVPRPNAILDDSRSRGETPSFRGLFQSTSHALRFGRTADGACWSTAVINLWFIPVATALSRALSNARLLISAIRHQHVCKSPRHRDRGGIFRTGLRSGIPASSRIRAPLQGEYTFLCL